MDRRPSRLFILAPVFVLLGGSLSACIEGSPSGEGSSSTAYHRHVSQKVPQPRHRLDAQFGDRIELLGYDVEPAEPEPGRPVRLTWYWHCKQSLGGTWQLFTHLVDRRSGDMSPGGNLDDESVDQLRSAYPPSRWQAGEFISEVQHFSLPSKIPFAEAELRVGIYQGRERLKVTKGPSDGAHRVRGPHFATGWTPPPVPEVTVPRATGTLTIDGRLDEPDWARAVRTGDFVNATDGDPHGPSTKARLLYDAQRLYLAFECDDDHLHSSFTKRDEQLWTQDAVEAFIDPRGHGRDYYEFQVSPAGVLFDTLVHHHPDRDDSYDGHPEAAVQIKGTLNNQSDRDQGWTVELAVPFAQLGPASVEPGTTWRLNLFRLDDQLRGRAFLGWSPPLSNTTHVPSRFAKLTFGPLAEPTPAASAPASESEVPNAQSTPVNP